MKTLVAYTSKYGCTEKCARNIALRLGGQVDVVNLKESKKPVDPAGYDRVIIGGSIYVGRIHKDVTEFCSDNLARLSSKKLGLFICCMREGDTARAELESAFPEELRSRAAACDYFGGEVILKKLGMLDRMMAKNAAKLSDDVINLQPDKVERFISAMAAA